MNYILKRIIVYVVIVLVTLNLDFFIPRFAPGNAATILAAGTKFGPQEVALLSAKFGLNQPLFIQYFIFLKNVFLTWPPYFGVSYQYYPQTVTYLLAVRTGWTFILILTSLAFAIILSYFMTGVSSLRRGGKFEAVSLYISIAFNSVPIYWTSMVLLWIFAVDLGWLPMFGGSSYTSSSGLGYLLSVIQHAILPVTVMTLSMFGESYLLLRGSTQEVQKSDYVTAATSRGLKARTVAFGYIVRNSLLPGVSILSFSMASLVSRVVIVEAIFGYPGVGDLIVDAILNRDYPVLLGSLFFVTLLVVIGGLIGDIVLMKLDPRIRRQQ